jgi:alanyl-tRNA synthetase
MMLFGEKYPDPVRMVSMGDFSKELCGGTHLTNTRQVQEFEIIAEESVSAGTRRIVALTGARAAEHRQQVDRLLKEAAAVLGCEPSALASETRSLVQRVRALKKQLGGGGSAATAETASPQPASTARAALAGYAAQRNTLREVARALNVAPQEIPARLKSLLDERAKLDDQAARLAGTGEVTASTLIEQAEQVGETSVIVAETSGATPNLMRQWIDQIRKQSVAPVAVLLASREGSDKVLLVAGISRALVDRGLSAGTWIGRVAPIVGGGGGGKPDLAQAGGKQAEKLPEAIQIAKQAMREMLG